MLVLRSKTSELNGASMVLLGSDDSSGSVAPVCLISRRNFVGNSRLMFGEYFNYPSIQGGIWIDESLETQELPGELHSELMFAWPALDENDRAEAARLFLQGFEYLPAEPGVAPDPLFDKEVHSQYELSNLALSAELMEVQASIPELISQLREGASRKLFSEFGGQLLPLASARLSEIVNPLRVILSTKPGEQDLVRWLSRWLLELRLNDASRKLHVNTREEHYQAYFTGMLRLGIRSVLLKDAESRPNMLWGSDEAGNKLVIKLV